MANVDDQIVLGGVSVGTRSSSGNLLPFFSGGTFVAAKSSGSSSWRRSAASLIRKYCWSSFCFCSACSFLVNNWYACFMVLCLMISSRQSFSLLGCLLLAESTPSMLTTLCAPGLIIFVCNWLSSFYKVGDI